nr:MAG TPA: hypothetical protein [Caudoviricetes sp.]
MISQKPNKTFLMPRITGIILLKIRLKRLLAKLFLCGRNVQMLLNSSIKTWQMVIFQKKSI